jgi:hypothetical protein
MKSMRQVSKRMAGVRCVKRRGEDREKDECNSRHRKDRVSKEIFDKGAWK